MPAIALLSLWTASADPERTARALDVLRASQPAPTYHDHLRDMLSELSRVLSEHHVVGPVAVLAPTVSGLSGEAAQALRVGVEKSLRAAGIDEAFCDPCTEASRATSEAIASGTLRDLALRVGATAFVRVHLAYERTALRLDLSLVRPDGGLAWAERIESDPKRAAMLDRGAAPVDAYASEMARLLPKKANFGIAAIAGILRMPWKVSAFGLTQKGDISGLMFAFRLYEAFGLDKAILIGIEARGFIDTEFQRNFPPGVLDANQTFPASGGMFTGVVAYTPRLTNDQRVPRVRFGGQIGVFLGGSLGNNVVGGGIIELLLVHRFGLNLALLYVGESTSALGPVSITVGGFTWAAGGSFNWD